MTQHYFRSCSEVHQPHRAVDGTYIIALKELGGRSEPKRDASRPPCRAGQARRGTRSRPARGLRARTSDCCHGPGRLLAQGTAALRGGVRYPRRRCAAAGLKWEHRRAPAQPPWGPPTQPGPRRDRQSLECPRRHDPRLHRTAACRGEAAAKSADASSDTSPPPLPPYEQHHGLTPRHRRVRR